MTTLLFVHGTGVRAEAFDQTFRVIANQTSEYLYGVTARACQWGEHCGAAFLREHAPASIPGYKKGPPAKVTPGADDPAAELRWSLLYDDPLYELRSYAALAQATADNDGLGGNDRSPFVQAPGAAALERLRWLVPANGSIARCGHQAVDLVPPALAMLRAEGVMESALGTPALADMERARPLLARAFVGAWAKVAEAVRLPALDGEQRQSLLEDAVAALGGAPAGLKDELLGALAGLASRVATPLLRRNRSAVTDASMAAINDILLYQTPHGGAAIRRYIQAEIERAPKPVVVLAHSLGGIACVELLVERPDLGVKALITCGSQAPFLYETDALSLLRRGKTLPQGFPKWLNVFDANDMLSYAASCVFDGPEDFEVRSGQPFPQSHSAYWAQAALWKRVKSFLA